MLRGAAILVLPSLSENFGNVVLEAMAAACPVVVTPEVGLARVVAESGAGVVTAGDPEALGKTLRAMLRDKSELERMGRRGRERALRDFTWDAVAVQMESAYREILQGVGMTSTVRGDQASHGWIEQGVGAPPVSVMIFTLNEEINLPACLESLAWCDDIIVIDSYSEDRTQGICEAAGVRFFQNPFHGFGTQRNWAMDRTRPKYAWSLILDADERTTPALVAEMHAALRAAAPDVAAYRLRRRFYLWGRWLRYSSLYPTWVVRLVHKERVLYVDRGHAETQEVTGRILSLDNDLIDENRKGIAEWFERQNRYSTQEARYELAQERRALTLERLVSADPLVRRALLKRVAQHVPGRAFFYFVYCYLLRCGFLDGRDGFIFCLMKSIYQQMIVIKKYDLRQGAYGFRGIRAGCRRNRTAVPDGARGRGRRV